MGHLVGDVVVVVPSTKVSLWTDFNVMMGQSMETALEVVVPEMSGVAWGEILPRRSS